MQSVVLAEPDDFDGWRDAARTLAMARVPAADVRWSVRGETADLFGTAPAGEAPAGEMPQENVGAFSVPRGFVDLARKLVCHEDPERFALLYMLLLRVIAQPMALSDKADPLVRRAEGMARAVRRDIHKMHAFVRFRELAEADGGTRFIAWFEPQHHIVRAVAGFFVERFATMRWSILTPALSIHWDRRTLSEGPGATRADAPAGDPVEETWKRYYAAIFNPARLKVRAMLKEMPKKYWANMPETALIGELVAGARSRELEMVERSRSQAPVPVPMPVPLGNNARAAWDAMKQAARGCTRCDLHRCATQTVFGEGPLDGPLMFVGEQPGDQEDLAGTPFVGPAGRLFDSALADAGIDRARAYVTNAVKHFKFEQRGKRRIHARPNGGEIQACRWWLEQERALIRPRITVALGATAVQSLFGKAATIASLRGTAQTALDGGETWVTVHPSFLLRVRDDKEAEYARFVEDLRRIGERVAALGPASA
ncbi:UdgX family uracil-DNA binding protein [soil metagenome]